MRSRLYRGRTVHARLAPTRHEFRYAMFWLGLDLDELEALDGAVAGFGHNRRALATIRDADYVDPGPGSIRAKVLARLREHGLADGVERIVLFTVPRVLGYVFNPVSFHVCLGRDGAIAALVAEVRNTFDETHAYVLAPEDGEGDGDVARFLCPKAFYVSPFLETDGAYEIRVRRDEEGVAFHVDLRQDGALVFTASMIGRAAPLTGPRLLATLARLPLFAATIMLRIHWQALLLRLRRGLPVHGKPDPTHPATRAPRRPGVWARLRAALVGRARDDARRPALDHLSSTSPTTPSPGDSR